jgi:hypothetical protein
VLDRQNVTARRSDRPCGSQFAHAFQRSASRRAPATPSIRARQYVHQ